MNGAGSSLPKRGRRGAPVLRFSPTTSASGRSETKPAIGNGSAAISFRFSNATCPPPIFCSASYRRDDVLIVHANDDDIVRVGALFLNASGERLSTQGMANVIAQFRRDAGIERHVTPHMLRHTVATLLLRNGVDIRVVQEFLGHASIATTQRYTHIAKEHLIGVLRKHHPSLGLRAKA